MTEVIIKQVYKVSPEKIFFLRECAWLKFNNFGFARGMALKLYTNVEKGF